VSGLLQAAALTGFFLMGVKKKGFEKLSADVTLVVPEVNSRYVYLLMKQKLEKT